MSKKIKFKFQELDYNNKILVYIDYINRSFFNSGFDEEWKYNNIEFNVYTHTGMEKGYLEIKYTLDNKINSFYLAIGTKENYFIINKNEVKIFEDLENIVYNDNKKPLSKYLKNNEYYILCLDIINLKFKIDRFSFSGDGVDEDYFINGNMFKSKEEVIEVIKRLNNKEINLKELKEERQKFFKNYNFD